jgi:hypothetical protein
MSTIQWISFIAVTATTEVPALLDLTVSPDVLAVPDVVPGMYADDGWDDVEVPRGPVNPRWRSTVIEFAQTRRYKGVIYEQSFSDNEQRLHHYQKMMQQAIFLCHGPRVFKACLELTATYCAVALCSGRAQMVVQHSLEKNRRLPLKRELFYLLDEDVLSIYIAQTSSEEKSSSLGSEEMLSELPGHAWIPSYV